MQYHRFQRAKMKLKILVQNKYRHAADAFFRSNNTKNSGLPGCLCKIDTRAQAHPLEVGYNNVNTRYKIRN